MCAVVQMVLLHRKQEASEEIHQHLSLLGDGKVSKVEERQNEIRLTGDASKDFQEKSCWIKLNHLVYCLQKESWTACEML